MTPSPEPAETSPPPRRPWYRLHFSTWAVLLLMLGLITIIEVPGDHFTTFSWKTKDCSEVFKHGWPWIFLDRSKSITFFAMCSIVSLNGKIIDPYSPPWKESRSWKIFEAENVFQFSTLNILLDLVVLAFSLFAICFLFEWRRRKRTRFLQFTLRELFLVIILTAGCFSYWKTNHDRRLFEEDICHRSHFNFGTTYSGSVLLQKIFGDEALDDFRSINDITIEVTESPEHVSSGLSQLKNFPHLTSVNIPDATLVNDENLAALIEQKNLQCLYLLEKSNITDASMEKLSELKELGRLYLPDAKITDKSIPFLARLTHLYDLNIIGTQITAEGRKKLAELLPDCAISPEQN
jgi:hypothetical protein